MAKRPPKGLSLDQAFRRWGDPVLVARLDELEPHAHGYAVGVTEHLHAEYNGVREDLDRSLIEKLERGELIARGLVQGAPPTQGKVDIDPERWAELEFFHDLDEVVGHRFVMTNIEIREADPGQEHSPADEQDPAAISTGQGDPEFEHDPDYRRVRLRGVRCNCGPLQARVLRGLHAASRTEEPWVNGKELLRQKPPIGSRSIRDLFKSKPNWEELIDSDGRGLYRLNLSRPDRSGG